MRAITWPSTKLGNFWSMHSGNKSSDMPACFRTSKRNDKTSVGRRRKNDIHCTEYCDQCAHRNSNTESNYAKVRHTSTCITQPSQRGRRQTVRLSRSSGRRVELHPNISSHKFLTVTLFGNGKNCAVTFGVTLYTSMCVFRYIKSSCLVVRYSREFVYL